VQVNGDVVFEANETFFVNLSSPVNATIADAQGVSTIVNDDAAPTLSIDDVTLAEGIAGTTIFTFTVTKIGATELTSIVDAQTADGTATAPSDYVAVALTTLTFAPTETSKQVTVLVNGDVVFEADETFFVNLSNPTNATITDNQGLGTILNDDTAPSLAINDVTLAEGNAGITAFTFTVTLTGATDVTASVVAQTANGSATAPSDYAAAGPTTLTFNPGTATQTFTVNVNGDVVFEADETFFVNLSNPTNATISDIQGQGTIVNDDQEGVNQAPVAGDDAYSINEDNVLDLFEVPAPAPGILANDRDPDGQTLTTRLVTAPEQGGQLILDNNTGLFIYTPPLNFNDTDTFTYVANDGTNDSNIATVTITVNAVNDAPSGTDNTVTTNEDTNYTFTVADFGFTDPNDTPANVLQAVRIATLPEAGTLTNDGVAVIAGQSISVTDLNGGKLVFTPAANANGSPYTSFTFQVQDNGGTANGGVDLDATANTMTFNVNAVNDAPMAVNDGVYTVQSSLLLTVEAPGVLANDSDVDTPAANLSAQLVSGVAHGTLTFNGNGSFTYRATEGYAGPDSFSYLVNDGQSENNLSNVAIVAIEVTTAADRAPIAEGDKYSTNEDTVLTVCAPGVLSNDSDADGNNLSAVLVSTTANGIVSLNPDGSFTYAPNANFFGTDSFTYKANDGTNDSNVATVNITVKTVNDRPVANDDAATTNGNTPATIDVLANDSDIDGALDPASFTIQSAASHGTLSIDPNTGKITYTAAVGFSGADSFTYRVKDNQGAVSNVATVQIEVLAASHEVPQVSLITDPCDPDKTALQVIGTDGDDKIRFVPHGNKGKIKVLINGVSQGIFKPSGRIIAYGLAGNDDIEVAGSIGLAAHLQGDSGNDRLKGGAGPSVLCGGEGDDLLIGGRGRSILIGEEGSDRLVGNGGDDILISGTTVYGCDHEAWCEILDQWRRTDKSYSERVKRLSCGPFALNRTTVFDDHDYDLLTGAAGNDWFFVGNNDKVTDRKPFEIFKLV
jgi:VCBS repeat-containing protein